MAKKKNRNKKASKMQKHHTAKSLLGGIWAVIRNSEDTKGEFTKTTFVLMMSCLLNMCAIMLGLLSVIGICVTVYEMSTLSWASLVICISNIFSATIMLFLCALSFSFAIVLRGFANEVEREDDKNYIVALFSGVVSFVALIISLIALFRR